MSFRARINQDGGRIWNDVAVKNSLICSIWDFDEEDIYAVVRTVVQLNDLQGCLRATDLTVTKKL